MATITRLQIDGFKAFSQNFTIDFSEGKNLLIYGENGSGKSSLYYALHVIFQSVFKDDRGAKYFSPLDPGGTIENIEHLINLNRLDEAKDVSNPYYPFIELTFDDGKKWQIDHGGLMSPDRDSYDKIIELNKHSIFINHSYVSRFRMARNSEDINLWNVFHKDIIASYLIPNSQTLLLDLYDEIIEDSKAIQITDEETIKKKIEIFNIALQDLIGKINSRASGIFNENFKDDDDTDIEIELIYLSNDDTNNKYGEKYFLQYHLENNVPNLLTPKIGLNIMYNEHTINKPQSFFNEAKMTAIALAVRFACLPRIDHPGAFIALDDMLISMDMSNRMKVINFLIKVILPKYKLYIFTHDKLLYTSLKKRIQINNQQKEWLFGSIYSHDRDNSIDFRKCNPYPVFIEDHDSLLKAREYYVIHDYPACGQQLRKWCEDILGRLYPDTLLKIIDNRTGKTSDNLLNDQIGFLKEFCKNESIEYSDFMNLKIYKDNILNTVSHYDVSSPIYGTEIISIMKILAKLDQLANGIKTIKVNQDLGIELTTDSRDAVTICIDIRSKKLRILKYQESYQISFYTKCIVNKIIYNGNHIKIDAETYNSIYEAYWYYIGFYGCDSSINLLDILKDHGTLVRDNL